MLIRLKDIIKRAVYKIVPPPFVYNQTFSQAGEDVIIQFLFADKKMRKINYLDIGTNLPNRMNNTYLFYLSGFSGVCVEADKTLIPLITKIRPRDKVLNIGISDKTEQMGDFYIFNFGMNTFDEKEVTLRTASGLFKVIEIVKVPLQNINSLIRNNFTNYPDLLSIDIEGLDLSVLRTLDFDSFPIPVICVETCMYSENHIRPKDLRIHEFLTSVGYKVYADTYINTIFVNINWFYK